ncbi:hypothetical protein GF351_04825 [Candidatus Woesearchaeota archaeon]|nr:hypothetical protein [Candidatus Woesearchaeota archaeon]
MEEKLEIRRQLFHLTGGTAALALIWAGMLTPLALICIILLGLLLSSASRNRQIPGVHWFLQRFARKEEMRTVPGKGPLTFLLGMLIALVLFQRQVALASIAILIYADSISHLVGRYYGRIRHPFTDKKFIEGAAAGAFAGFLGAVLFVDPVHAFTASTGAMLMEGLEINIRGFRMDDNLTIPVVSGMIIIVSRLIF